MVGGQGFGFVRVKGKTVFCHAGRVVAGDCLRVGSVVWVRVMRDGSRQEESWKAGGDEAEGESRGGGGGAGGEGGGEDGGEGEAVDGGG